MVPTVGEILRCSTLTNCTVGKYSLINPSPLCLFFGGFLARAIDQILSRVDLRFFLPPSLPITLSSHLNQAISTLYPRPRSSFSEISISNSLFLFFFRAGYSSPHEYTIYLYVPITPFSEIRKRESKKRKETKKRASSCLPYSNQNIHTYIPLYVHTYMYLLVPTPPSVFKRV